MSIVELMFTYVLQWYVMLFVIGIIFYPFVSRIFHAFYDKGYGLSKAFGIAVLSYIMYFLGTYKIIPFTQAWVIGILAILALAGYFISKRFPNEPLSHNTKALLFFEEFLTACAFFVWAYVRAHEPAIHGLEKFMDFGFINAALRGQYFPTEDMWLAGNHINYYYFGHITGAVLTRLSSIPSYITYNLILAQLCALSVAGSFTFVFNLAYFGIRRSTKLATVTALIGVWFVNFAGNLHTIYAFTQGYPNEKPLPFWQLAPKFTFADFKTPLESLDKLSLNYWYPNATRFIPFTIHEFPLYSYVVADLHGHVFDIPFVLITLCLLLALFIHPDVRGLRIDIFKINTLFAKIKADLSFERGYLSYILLIGFFISIHFMTNAFDAPIYLGLAGLVLLGIFGLSRELFTYMGVIVGTFMLINTPFSAYFIPFSSGVGFNCVSSSMTQTIQSLIAGTGLESRLLFEGNCQSSTWWMLLTLWGFFWVNFVFFVIKAWRKKFKISRIDSFILIICAYSTLIIVASEFVYAKDIYPSHFRANTMFKLGYGAFIMLAGASAFILASFKSQLKKSLLPKIYLLVILPLIILISIYPTFAVLSFYGQTSNKPSLDGQAWLKTSYADYLEIITYLNTEVTGQPHILEAQGDSYSDYNVVSAYTGLPTIGGWYVHEWLWRGDSNAIGALQKDISDIYESKDEIKTRQLLKKWKIEYVIVGKHEKEKYANLYESKFEALGQPVLRSRTGTGTIYQIPVDTQ